MKGFRNNRYPEHDRTSCNDENLANVDPDGSGCRRCNALLFNRYEELLEQVQAWKRDAERYRSASKPESDGAVDICICRVNWETGTKEVLTGDRAHTAIDAAMEKQP